MKVELQKKFRKWKKGEVIDVTTDLGRELIEGGTAKATDKESYNDIWLKGELADEENATDGAKK
jgi:hypothetical protein